MFADKCKSDHQESSTRHHSKTAVGIWVSADTTAAVTIMRAGQLVGHNGPS